MGDVIVRRVNVGYGEFAPPLASTASPRRRAYINELGFRIFSSAIRNGIPFAPQPSADTLSELERSTAFFISRLRSVEEMPPAEPAERDEALSLSRRLYAFFTTHERAETLTVGPVFAGCGIVNTCAGDLLAGQTLYEVKAGARDFRLVDVRQVITYCALNFASRQYDIRRAVLVNPRRGIYAQLDVHADLARASGASASEVYAQLLDFMAQDLSQGDTSRVR